MANQAIFRLIHRYAAPEPEGNSGGYEAPVYMEKLTEREVEVLQLMAYGKKNREISRLLTVSEGTVKTNVHSILQKFGVEDRTQAVVLGIRVKLVN